MRYIAEVDFNIRASVTIELDAAGEEEAENLAEVEAKKYTISRLIEMGALDSIESVQFSLEKETGDE